MLFGLLLRRVASYSALVCLLAGAQPANAQEAGAPTLAKIRFATTANDGGMQAYYAQELGLFKKAGIDAEITATGNGANIVAGVISGAYDIGVAASVSVVSAYQSGLPIVLVSSGSEYLSTRPNNQLLVLKDSPFHKAADLNNKTIAVVVLLNSAHVATRAWLDKRGGDSSTVKFIEMPYTVMLEALKAHRVDAASISEPFMHAALAEARSIGAPYDGVASRFLMGGMFARSDYAKANPELMRKLNTVIGQAGAWANSHPVESAELMKKYLKAEVPPGTIRFFFSPDLSAPLLQPLIDVSAKYGALKTNTPASEIIFNPGPAR